LATVPSYSIHTTLTYFFLATPMITNFAF